MRRPSLSPMLRPLPQGCAFACLWREAVYVMWRTGERFIPWLTAAAAMPLPPTVLFRQAVTRYAFLWLEQPTPVPTSLPALRHRQLIQPIQLETQPYWWTNAG